MKPINKLLMAATLLLWTPPVARAQDVFKEISSQRLEDILKSMNIQYTKGGDNKGTNWYDYKSKNVMLRLTNYSGKDLMVDVFLPKVDWEVINRWNGNAKFSRARLNKDSKSGVESTVIESNIDLVGGVTEDTVKHFIRSFDLEVASWSNTSAPAAAEEDVFKNLSADRLENVLKAMNINYNKVPGKGNVMSYDFDRTLNGVKYSLRLTNFGSEDIMIDCHYPDAPLAKVNQWNVKRSYVRAVRYPGGGKPYVALEANLDCAGGNNDSIIRYFITTFDAEVTAFDDFLRK